jgi:hypothetical protein
MEGWILHHYLDNFITFFPPDSDLTLTGSQFKNIWDQLGFQIADDTMSKALSSTIWELQSTPKHGGMSAN